MKKLSALFLSAAAVLAFSGCAQVETTRLSDTKERGVHRFSTEDNIASWHDRTADSSRKTSALQQKLTSLDKKTLVQLKKSGFGDKYQADISDKGDYQACINALENLAIAEMTVAFDRKLIERGLEIMAENNSRVPQFREIASKHLIGAKKNRSNPVSKRILLYHERLMIYKRALARFKENDCADRIMIRDIPYFAILELELLALQEEYEEAIRDRN